MCYDILKKIESVLGDGFILMKRNSNVNQELQSTQKKVKETDTYIILLSYTICMTVVKEFLSMQIFHSLD